MSDNKNDLLKPTVLTRELCQEVIRRSQELLPEPDPLPVVSPAVHAAYCQLFPANAAQILPNGMAIPALAHKKLVTCGKCNRLEGACNCYEMVGPPGVAAPAPSPAPKTWERLDKSPGGIGELGSCYICAHPGRRSVKHLDTGVRYCGPCAVQHFQEP